MQQYRISGLPVINAGGALVGMVTEADCQRRVETGTEKKRSGWRSFLTSPELLADEYIHSHGRKIGEVMTTNPITVSEETELDEIIHLMEKHQIKRVPVVKGREVVGIVSRANLVQALAGLLRGSAPVREDDVSIREKVRQELGKLPWAASDFVTAYGERRNSRPVGLIHRLSPGCGRRRCSRECTGRQRSEKPSRVGRSHVGAGRVLPRRKAILESCKTGILSPSEARCRDV